MKTWKEKARALRWALEGAKRPLCLIYGNPDPDALASAWALKWLAERWGGDLDIAYTGVIGRLENQTLVDEFHIPIEPVSERRLAEADLVAVVDAQPEFFKSPPLPRCDIVIDHHPRKSRKQRAFVDIRPRCQATVSILTGYLRTEGVAPPRGLATALFYGFQTDSKNNFRKPRPEDIAAMDFLAPLADRRFLRRIEFTAYSLKCLDYFTVALSRMIYVSKVLFSHVGPVSSGDALAQIADFLVRVKEVEWSVVSGIAGDRLVVVFRYSGMSKHAGHVAEAAFDRDGSAGGHRSMARAEIHADKLPEDLLFDPDADVPLYIARRLADADKTFRALLRATLKRR